jgi:hypothetical protein
MKVRQGFVSNSSTTSFCIYGVGTNEPVSASDIKKAGLSYEYFQEYSEHKLAIGLPFTDIENHETGAEFKSRVRTAVRKVLPTVSDDDFGVQEDAYRDG